ncbi:hypothetical protein KFE25_006464 [Diacronema lutheri]|uniref:SAM domain-containing protein n=1 Tax=Diacronema lutheri TaxID=2081491 RepID=A0A8J5XT30_DIALT|nr:hypothetical protein KFE25_006464 [Diacronema lutheri]
MVLHKIDYKCTPTKRWNYDRHTTRYFLVQIRNLQHVAEGQALLCRLAHIHTQLTGRPPRYNVAPLRTHNVPRNVRLTANAIWETLPDDERKELRVRLKALDLRDHDVVALAAARVGGEEVAVDALGGQADTRTDVGAGSVEDVSAWLDDIGFADLKKKFASNVIDGPALREITEEELKELGVKKIGARKLFGRMLCEALPDCERPNLTAPEGELNVSAMSVSEVGEWLGHEGFADAKKAFATQGVDGQALLDLNEDELKVDLGVAKLGQRRRFARTLCTVMPGCRNPRRADVVASWSVGDVNEWLKEIGLGKYVRKFASHEVDGMTLPDISEDELKSELGVSEIGLRKRFRAQLCTLDAAFCPQPQREEASSDALGLGGLDLAQYVQKAQAYLQQRAAEKAANGEAADTEIAQLVNAALSKRGADGEGEAAADAQPEA